MAKGRQYSLVFIGGEGDPLAASTLPLVAALIAFDCQPRPESPFIELIEDISPPGTPEEDATITREHRWIFSDQSTCGKYHTDQLRKAWHSSSFLAGNPTHPLTRIRGAFHLAGVATVAADPASEWLDCSPDDLSRFLASAAAHGPLPEPWLAKDYRAKHRATFPTLAAVADAFALLPLLRAELAKSVPLMVVRKGERRAFVPIDATPEEEAQLLSRLEKTTH